MFACLTSGDVDIFQETFQTPNISNLIAAVQRLLILKSKDKHFEIICTFKGNKGY